MFAPEMRTAIALGLCVILGPLASPFLHAQSSKTPAAEAPAVTDEQIQQWIKQLGDEDFKIREAANLRLYEVGEAALNALKRAATDSDDLEVRYQDCLSPR